MVACHEGAGTALHCVHPCQWCLARQLRVIDPQGQNTPWSSEGTQKGGEGRYRNIITHEYASIPLLWWSWDCRIEECWITHQCYLDKLAALWHTGIARRNMWPSLTLSRNPNFMCRDCLFITTESTCISSLWRDVSILLPPLEKKEPSISNKWVISVDIFPAWAILITKNI